MKHRAAETGSVYDALMADDPGTAGARVVIPSSVDRLSLAPATRDLTGAEIELISLPQRERRLKLFIDAVKDRFEYVVIDCPPSLGLLTLNGLVAADTRAHSAALRVLRARRAGRSRRHHAPRARRLQPGARDRRRAADDVRRAHQSRPAGGQRRARVLQGEGLPHRDPAQRAARRGAEPRHARCGLRRPIARRRGLLRAGARSARRAAATNPPPDFGVHHGKTTRPRQGPQRAHPRRARGRAITRRRWSSTSIRSSRASSSPASTSTRHGSMVSRRRSAPTASCSPIVVRRTGSDRYQIIAGERRWRAAQRAGLDARARGGQGRAGRRARHNCSSGRWSRTCSARI